MRKAFIFIYAVILQINTALATTCSPGYYPLNGVCTICPMYYACPDGENTVFCSEQNPAQYTNAPGSTKCIDCPTNINDANGFVGMYVYRGDYGTADSCRAIWQQSRPHGNIKFSCYYSNGGYDTGTAPSKCMIDVVACDAGYVPVFNWIEASKAYRIWTNSYATIPTEVCRPVGIGKYSPTNELTATACPNGTSTHNDTATSVDECKPLCAGGITRLRAGNYTFNLWPDKQTSPALNVRTPSGNTCYVNTAANTGTLNIRYNNRIYHAVN